MNIDDNINQQLIPVNLGNPQEITIKELAEIIKKKTKSNSNIIFKELPENDPKVRRPCIEKAKQYLIWEPKINLDKGLEKTIEYFIKK